MTVHNLVFQACENGRGAILLSVARGKVSEGIDFGAYPAANFMTSHIAEYYFSYHDSVFLLLLIDPQFITLGEL